jgi:hypothetical protein
MTTELFPVNSQSVAYGDGTTRPSPYGDLSLDIHLGATVVQHNLTTGRRLRAGAAIPRSDCFNYSDRREKIHEGFPQSIPSNQSGFASNPETITYPNKDPFPVMIGILDAQISAMKQEEAGRAAARASLGTRADAAEIVERMLSPAELYFEEQKKRFDAKKIARLQAAGYTDEEIAKFIAAERQKQMAAASTRDAPEDGVAGIMRILEERLPATGSGAVGIGSQSAARERADGPSMSAIEALMQRPSARGTGGSVASLLAGPEDPRAALSVAARRATPPEDLVYGAGAASIIPTRGVEEDYVPARSRKERKAAAKAEREALRAAGVNVATRGPLPGPRKM